jgi:hypothetical protein
MEQEQDWLVGWGRAAGAPALLVISSRSLCVLARVGSGLADWSSDSLAGRGIEHRRDGGPCGAGQFARTRIVLGWMDCLRQMDNFRFWGEFTPALFSADREEDPGMD